VLDPEGPHGSARSARTEGTGAGEPINTRGPVREAIESVRERGFAVLTGCCEAEDLRAMQETLDALHARFGSPPLYSREPRWIEPHVEIARPGLAIYQLLRFAPELAPRLFPDEAIGALRGLLGERMHLELVGAVTSDETRPFTEWETHLGGIDDERWRIAGKRPRQTEVRRVVCFVMLDALDDESGAWRVLPRAVGDPVDPPGSLQDPDWPGAYTLRCDAGTVLLLEESAWHCVLPSKRPGRRRFVGAYFASPSASPTVGRDDSLDALRVDDARFASLLAHRPAAS
jgi:hypothetical protein